MVFTAIAAGSFNDRARVGGRTVIVHTWEVMLQFDLGRAHCSHALHCDYDKTDENIRLFLAGNSACIVSESYNQCLRPMDSVACFWLTRQRDNAHKRGLAIQSDFQSEGETTCLSSDLP